MRELSLHIMDIVQNSLAAGAKHVHIEVNEDMDQDVLRIEVRDDGCGMDEEMAVRALDPFGTTRKTRHVGLGLPMFKAAAERCNGSLSLHSQPGKGTRVVACFQHSHIDRAPLGDMVGTITGLITCNPEVDFTYRHRVNGQLLELDTAAIKMELGEVPINHPEVVSWIRDFLRQEYRNLGGAEHEIN